MADEDEYIGPSRENYLPCSVCGRTFAPQSLKKHINVCRKQATKKRKVFDSQRQRFDGTEISTLKPKLASAKQSQPLPQKKSNWRQEHEEFVKTIRAAKGVTQALKEGGPLPPPPPPSLNPDYVQCPCCQRRFNEGAAERHIMFCKEQAARIGRSGPSQQASSRLAVRIQYRVPSVKKKDGATPSQMPALLPSRSHMAGTSMRSAGAGATGALASRLREASPAREARTGVGKASSSSSTPSRGGSTYGREVEFDGPPLRTGRSAGRRVASELTPIQRTPARSPTPPSGYKSMGSSAPRRTGPTRAALNERNDGIGGARRDPWEHSNGDETTHARTPPGPSGRRPLPRFCYECGTRHPVDWAKFCCECGARRVAA
ncbi:zinc finger C2HC domain-containing protein 1B-like isoform X1 [Lampetra fluviatilis]